MPEEIAPKIPSERIAQQAAGSQLNAQGAAEPSIASLNSTWQKATSQKVTSRKINWQKTGHVAEPGRYMYRFGWLTVTAEDIAVWQQYPQAEFTMLQLPKPSDATAAEDALDELDEYHLGTFELPRA